MCLYMQCYTWRFIAVFRNIVQYGVFNTCSLTGWLTQQFDMNKQMKQQAALNVRLKNWCVEGNWWREGGREGGKLGGEEERESNGGGGGGIGVREGEN